MAEQEIQVTDIQGHTQSLRVIEEVSILPTSHSQEDKSIILIKPEDPFQSLYVRTITDQAKPMILDDALRASFKSNADAYMYVWNELNSFGLPVIDTVLKIDDMHIAQTNLTAEGYSVYDIKIDSDPNRVRQENDAWFAQIPIDDIRKRAQEITDIATSHSVRVAHDGAYHLIVNSEGSWDLIMLDLGAVAIGAKKIDQFGMSLEEDNARRVNAWLDTLQVAQNTVSDGLK